MKNKLIIFGAGGLGRALKMSIDSINKYEHKWDLIGFVDDVAEVGKIIVDDLTVLGNSNFLINYKEEIHVVIALGNVFDRKNIHENLKVNPTIQFPNLVHPSAIIEEKTFKMGVGNSISAHVFIGTNTVIGDFNHIRSKCSISHDVEIGDYNGIFPGVLIGGGVKIRDSCEIGIGTAIRHGIVIDSYVKTGGNSFVMRNPEGSYSYLGNPAKKFFKVNPKPSNLFKKDAT